MKSVSLKLIKHLPRVDICKICGYRGSARYLLIQIDVAGNATWNDGVNSQPCPKNQRQLLIQLDLQLGLTKYRVHDYRQTVSVNCLLWECETHRLYFEARTNALALIENQWQRDTHSA